jgi:hypothetical protein
MDFRRIFWPKPPAESTAMNRLGFVVYWFGVALSGFFLCAVLIGNISRNDLEAVGPGLILFLLFCRGMLYILANR